MRSSLLIALGSIVLSPIGVSAQGTWSFRSASANPPAFSPAMAFDSARNVCVMVAYNPAIGFHQAWEWNGTNWLARGAIGTTQGQMYHHTCMAFDPTRNVTVLFGGGNRMMTDGGSLGFNNLTIEWDGNFWTFATPPQSPPARTKAALAYDAARQKVTLFGGLNEGLVLRDTWTWDGQSWTQRNPVASPAPRHGHAMAYDSTRQRIVVFGGTDRVYVFPPSEPPTTFGDTWEYDGTNWFEVQSPIAPSPRQECAMAYDPTSRMMILHGGYDSQGTSLGDTWGYDGTWRLLRQASSPARRYDGAMAFDSNRGVAVLYGGSNLNFQTYLRDTWEFRAGSPASYAPFGTGCTGSRGIPTLAARMNSLPVAGQVFNAQITGLPLTGQAFVFLGASRTQYGPLPLPFDLTLVGMPNCFLRASGDFLFPVTNVLGMALWSLDVPISMQGVRFYNQVIAVDPSANALGLTVSNGAEALVGF